MSRHKQRAEVMRNLPTGTLLTFSLGPDGVWNGTAQLPGILRSPAGMPLVPHAQGRSFLSAYGHLARAIADAREEYALATAPHAHTPAPPANAHLPRDFKPGPDYAPPVE